MYARSNETRLSMAGPAVLIATISVWGALAVVGWALVYLPYLPEHFRYATPMVPAGEDGLGVALYLSLVTLATLGYGDITPLHPLLRLVSPTQAFLGFILLTVGISWTLSIKPVLAERRGLALAISALRAAEAQTDPQRSARENAGLRLQIAHVTNQLTLVTARLVQSPETYYFHPGDDDFSLAEALPYLYTFAGRLTSDANEAADRSQGLALQHAVEQFSRVVADQFLDLQHASVDRVLHAYARDHLREAAGP